LGLAEDGKQTGGRQVPADLGMGHGSAPGFEMYGRYHGGRGTGWVGLEEFDGRDRDIC
jgi:hypothetical protein